MSRFARVAALEANDPLLAWIWAVNEQEQLWLVHDARWVGCAEQGWPKDDDIYDALSAYGLLRGERGGSFSKSERASKGGADKALRSRLAAAAVAAASRLLKGDAEANTEAWVELDREVGSMVGCASSDWCMPSMTLKMMWFSAPSVIPMYDRYAFKGVNKEKRREHRIVSPSRYLACCYEALEKHEALISNAIRVWGSTYRHRLRILDKYLWLQGSGRAHHVRQQLARFHAACVALSYHDEGEFHPFGQSIREA